MAIQSESLEKVVNKSTNTALGSSDVLYPTQNAVKTYIDNNLGASTVVKNLILDIFLNAFRIAVQGSLTIFNMVAGFVDEYEDESGVDTTNSINQTYNSTDDYYSPSTSVDSYTKLLLHFNGTDASTTFTDETGKTVTPHGNAQIDTAQLKLGTASGLFDGAGDYLSVADSADWYLGSSNFTVECFIRLSNITQPIIHEIIGQYENDNDFIRLAWWNHAGTGRYGLRFDYISGGVLQFGITQGTITGWATNTWYHIAVVRNGNTITIYKDGTSVASGTYSGTIQNFSAPLQIGSIAGSGDFNGWIDELRWSLGIARWTTSFTPPTTEYSLGGGSVNMTLISNVKTALTAPTSVRIVLFEEDIDAITLNTDLIVYVSRNDGTNWTEGTLENMGTYSSLARILTALIDVSSQPSGTNLKYKIVTANTKNLKIHGTGLHWQ
jgi:hypothetical protein